MKMKNLSSKFRIMLSVAMMIIGLAFLCVNAKSDEVFADTGYTVVFDYNTSGLSSNMTMSNTMRESVANYSISNFDSGYLTDADVRTPSNLFNSYYSYVWTWNGQVVADITEFQIVNNTTFVMQWTPKTYSVFFNFADDETKSKVTNLVEKIEFTIENGDIELYEPEIPNYHFDGWYDGAKPYELMYLPAGSTGSKTLTARFTPIEYIINYNTDAKNDDNPIFYNVNDGVITLTEPSKEGHIFKGWYTDNNYTNKVSIIDCSLGGNVTLYPLWELEVYTVTFFLPNGYSKQVKVSYGEDVKLPNIEKNIFEIVVADGSRKNITQDTTIHIKVVNIWYVYVLILAVVVGVVVAIIMVKKKRDALHDNLRYRYQTGSGNTRKATVSIIEKQPIKNTSNKTTARTQTKTSSGNSVTRKTTTTRTSNKK